MTIHVENPFADPATERNQVRRFRGRLAAPVTIWASWDGEHRPQGLTVSSLLVAQGEAGEPGELIGLISPSSDLFDAMTGSSRVAVSVLSWPHRQLADAMAGLTPAPGGPFTLAEWVDTEWGPVLADGVGWLGAVLVGLPQPSGRSMLVRCVIEHVR